jgi:uncharacterized protein
VARTARLLADGGLLGEELDVRWHAGEPLAAGLGFYADAAARLAVLLGPHVAVRHSVQTNGLFLNDAWMELFRTWDFRVGVSVDGPAVIHDAYRRTRGGRGTLASVERRLGLFARHALPFDVISVVTPHTLDHADAYLDYMAELAPRSLGVNIEESEGPHHSTAIADRTFVERFGEFAERLVAWSVDTGIPVREAQAVHEVVSGPGREVINTQNLPGAILTVAVNGDLTTYSPELAGQSHPLLDGFTVGNVDDPDILASLRGFTARPVARQIQAGTELCRRSCPYFAFCGGGAPANKLYENGTFASTRTVHCRTTVMAFVEAYLNHVEQRAS